MPKTPTPLVLCADDYGLAAGVSKAILRLIEHGRLSATSCMTVCQPWQSYARELADAGIDTGLHVTLTDQPPLGPMPTLAANGHMPALKTLMSAAMRRRLDRAEVRAEICRQVDAFSQALGRRPDFIDGHQHVHLLPIVRDEVLALFTDGTLPAGSYLRLCWEKPLTILRRGVAVKKALLIANLSRGLKRETTALGIRANDSFRGIRDFSKAGDYRRLFRRYLWGDGMRSLIMCHPGYVDDGLRAADPVTDQRDEEFVYFAGENFLRDLAAAGRRLARFDAFPAP